MAVGITALSVFRLSFEQVPTSVANTRKSLRRQNSTIWPAYGSLAETGPS
jgi:hypothetical protein